MFPGPVTSAGVARTCMSQAGPAILPADLPSPSSPYGQPSISWQQIPSTQVCLKPLTCSPQSSYYWPLSIYDSVYHGWEKQFPLNVQKNCRPELSDCCRLNVFEMYVQFTFLHSLYMRFCLHAACCSRWRLLCTFGHRLQTTSGTPCG